MFKRIPGKKVSSKIYTKAILKSKFKYKHRMSSSGIKLWVPKQGEITFSDVCYLFTFQ